MTSKVNKMAKKEKVEFDVTLHSEALEEMIKDASNQKTMMESYAEKIKEIKKRAKDECGVDTGMFNDLFRIYHKQERDRFEDSKDQVVSAYDQIFKK